MLPVENNQEEIKELYVNNQSICNWSIIVSEKDLGLCTEYQRGDDN